MYGEISVTICESHYVNYLVYVTQWGIVTFNGVNRWGHHQIRLWLVACWVPGVWFNKMMSSYQYRKFHYGDKSLYIVSASRSLNHWGRVTHICVSTLNIIGSDNGLLPGRRQAIIWTSAGILPMWPSGTNFSEMLIEIHTFSFKKMHLKMSFGKVRPFCLNLNVLTEPLLTYH